MKEKFWLYFIIVLSLSGLLLFQNLYAPNNVKNSTDITFFVVADTHFDPPPESDQYYHTIAMNSVCGSINNRIASVWPEFISCNATNFGSTGKIIDTPNGVIMAGDITDRADPRSLELFKSRYEKRDGDKVVNFPIYVGLGNHDLDPQHVGDRAEVYKSNMLNYVAARHEGKDAPVPVTNFDNSSKNYSWDWEGVHFVQTHRFAGNTENGQISSINWLKEDLSKYASDNHPVVIIQHYGFDEWSLDWSTNDEREILFETIKDYNIIGIFVGHNHVAENLTWKGIDVFQVNNAWPDNDGNGSFSICKITDSYIDVVTCRWKNEKGDVELIAPFFHKEFKSISRREDGK